MFNRISALLSAIILLIFTMPLYADVCNKPFPQNVTYPYGLKPNNYTDAEMNQHVQAWYEKWRDKYVTNTDCNPGEWRVERVETGNSITNGCAESDTVSEGIGYGMVVMVYMSSATNNTKQYFDGMWAYYNSHLDGNGLMNWQVPYCNSGGAATDADEDVAKALIAAHYQWGSGGAINYRQEAISLIDKVLQHEITANNDVRPGDSWDGGNISYFAPYEYRMFGDFTGNARWYDVATHTYNTIVNYYQNSALTYDSTLGMYTGMQPNWCDYDGNPWSPGDWCMRDNTWWWDAIRHPWRQGYDYILYGTMNHQLAKDAPMRISEYFKVKYSGDPSQIKSHYELDGTETTYCREDRTPDLCDEDVMNLPGPVGAVAVAAMAGEDQAWINALYAHLVTMDNNKIDGVHDPLDPALTETGVMWGTDYFCDLLKMQYLLILTGNMPNPLGDYPTPTPTNTWNVLTPTDTPTPVPPPGLFDNFEGGALKNPSTSESDSGYTFTVTNSAENPETGARSLKGEITGTGGWAIFSIDSPNDSGLGYRDFSQASTVEFDIYAPDGTVFFIEVEEAVSNDGEGERFSNRGNPITKSGTGWEHISINISSMTRDTYTPAYGDDVFDLQAVKSFLIQFENPGEIIFYIDNVEFPGNYPTYTPSSTITPTKTPQGTFTNTPNRSATFTRTLTPTSSDTPYYSPTSTDTNTPYYSPTITMTNTATPDVTPGLFDDFETGALANPDISQSGGGSTMSISNSGADYNPAGYGNRSMELIMEGTGWAVGIIDSPYAGSGYSDYTGAAEITFYINAPAGSQFFLKIMEAGINGGESYEEWSNRDSRITASGGWELITIPLSQLTVDAYYGGAGDGIFDLQDIKSVGFQWDNPGSQTVYIDDIKFTGMPVPTPLPSLTNTPYFSPTGTPTGTVTFTPSYTGTPSLTRTNTPVDTATPTASYSPETTLTFTVTQTDTRVPDDTFTATKTHTPEETLTATPPDTFTNTPENTPSETFTATSSATQTITLTNTGTFTVTISGTPTGTFSPTMTGTFTATETDTPDYSPTPTCTGSPPTRTVTPTGTDTFTQSPTPTFTATGTDTPVQTATFTHTDTPANTATNTPEDTLTFTPTDTLTFTQTLTPTYTATYTPTDTATDEPTLTFTSTATGTASCTPTNTDTPDYSPTPTYTGTPPTLTDTPTVTESDTRTATETATGTATGTATFSYTPTVTLTFEIPTLSFTPTFTLTSGHSLTNTPTATLTPYPATYTYTPTSTLTLYPATYTYTPTATATLTPYPASPTMTPSAAATKEVFEVADILAYPNPVITGRGGDVTFRFTVTQDFSGLSIMVYTSSMRRIREIKIPGGSAARHDIPVGAGEFSSLAGGVYYYVITGESDKGEKAGSAIGKLIIMK